jgi:F420-non-reducing hydrogenase small subunit
MYWAASCGGCEISLLNLNENLLQWTAALELVFCPCLLDTKTAEVEQMPDASIDITLFNGAIRTTENVEMARLLRRKSRILVAFGACSMLGSIPALANLTSREDLLRRVYLDNPSTENPAGTTPQVCTHGPEGDLELPALLPSVRPLADFVQVDYSVPGCPPEPHTIDAALTGLVSARPPERGSVLGCGPSTVCKECARQRTEHALAEIRRPHQVAANPTDCLLDQGLLCLGPATRQGCGSLCPKVNMPCTGCYGPPDGISDQGAKMVAALGSVLDVGPYRGMSTPALKERSGHLAEAIVDPVGSWYRYSLATSILGGQRGQDHQN